MAKVKTSNLPKLPFSVGDRAAFIRKAAVAIEVFNLPCVKVLTFNIAYTRVEVIDVPVSRISDDTSTREQYYIDGGHVSGGTSSMAKTHLSWLRSQALIGGATPEAVRLLAKTTGVFSKKEEAQMAEKLKATKSAAKPDKEALKTAAKNTPVSKKSGDAPKKNRGNPEALAKARAAKGPDTRKVKALVKPKDLTAREGSFRYQMLTDLLSSKTVQEWRDKDKKYDAGCLKFAVDSGIVSVA